MRAKYWHGGVHQQVSNGLLDEENTLLLMDVVSLDGGRGKEEVRGEPDARTEREGGGVWGTRRADREGLPEVRHV